MRIAIVVTLGTLAAGCYESRGDPPDAPDSTADSPDAEGAADTTPDETTVETFPEDGGTDAPADGDDDGSAEADAEAGPWPVTFTLRFISDIPESIWVDDSDASGDGGHWLSIDRGAGVIRKAPSCAECMCDDCPSCPVCGAPCPTAREIPSGGSFTWVWTGMEYPSVPCPRDALYTCQQPTPSPAGSYTARFCWGLRVEGTPPCPATVLDVHCQDVPFELPDADGLVEFLVDNGG